MLHTLSRRDLLLSAPAGLSIAALVNRSAEAHEEPLPAPLLPYFPQIDPDLSRKIVGLSHAKFDDLRPLVEERPALANAAIDWGFGDWETALGAASHMGRRDIAEFLISHGARPDVFTLAMFGNLAAVRAIVEASPGIQRLHGPHGITLLSHAKVGGDSALPVVEYLNSLGDADPKYRDDPITDADRKSIQGQYAFGPLPTDRLVVGEGMGGITIMRAGGVPRRLLHQGGLEFHPAGATRVRVKFTLEAQRPAHVRVTDGSIEVNGEAC